MGKVCPFPENKKKKYQQELKYSSQTMFLKELIDTLILTYEEKIETLKEYKEKIEQLDGLTCKSPKEVSKQVKQLNDQFLEMGISCNYFKFFTKQNQAILYYSDGSGVFVIKNAKLDQAIKLTVGEFINEFEGYPFSLTLDDEILRIFDKQINKLEITIDTLKNTSV